MNKNTEKNPIKYVIIAFAAVFCILWVLTELFGVLPQSFIWPMRIVVIAVAAALYIYLSKQTKGKSGKKGR